MSCVRAAPTAVPATRPATPSTVMAVGSTLVGEQETGQGHHPTRILHYSPYLQSSAGTIALYPSLQVPHGYPPSRCTF